MPQESQLAHRVLTNLALPYWTNVSPTNTDPHYISGATDILTSINNYAERRPGFAINVEQTPTAFNNLQRLFSWDRFDGTFFIMACDIDASNFANVYKLQVGMDASFVLIFTEPAATGSAYDFVNSNNTLYFSNGFYVRKWDPVNGVSNWGIAPYNAVASVSEYAGTAANDASIGTVPWNNPGNATGPPDGSYADATVTNTTNSQGLLLTNFGFSIAAGNTITGIQVNVTAHVSSSFFFAEAIAAYLIQNGVRVGTPANAQLTSTGDVVLNFGGPSSLWNATWSPTTINKSGGATDFGVELVAGTPNPSNDVFIDSAQIVVSSTGGPTVSVAGSGTMTATVGYQYVLCWGNSNTGHVSSPSPPSNSTGPFGGGISTSTLAASGLGYAPSDTGIVIGGESDATYTILTVNGSGAVLTYSISAAGAGYQVANNLPTAPGGAQPGAGSGFTINITAITGAAHVDIPVVASTDPQVNQIRIFRTTDSANGLGGQAYFEIPNSPVPNTSATITDDSLDINLNISSIAPVPTFNDPPSSVPNGGLKGLVYFSGRIWGFTGNQVWFTGLEEITIGVPEESMPSGIAGDFWSFDEPVQALDVAGIGTNQGLMVLCGGRSYAVQGNTLDTFVRFQISNRRGARNRTCASALGGMMGWLDSANQVWATDGTNLNELTTLIRNDLSGINQASCSTTFHTAGRFHWFVLSTGEKLYVYDVDQDQWTPPWIFAATYIYSGEISPGNYVLMASNGTKAIQLDVSGTAGSYNDNGSTYQPVAKFGLLSIVPDYGTRFSYVGVGSYNEPTRTGYPTIFQVTNNGQSIADFSICQDDDPTLATYTSIAANEVDTSVAFNRQNGANMTQLVYPTTAPAARWIGMQITLEKADQADNLYEVFMGYKGLGGR